MNVWSVYDVVALSRLGKLTNAERIALIQQHACLQEALASIGASDLGLTDHAAFIVDTAAAEDVQIVPYGTEAYPQRLLLLEQPPLILYVQGTLPPAMQPSIAVVGTRTCTVQYGKPVTEMLVKSWTERGCTIISGLAKGIDTLGHETCLRHGGCTVAVVASGLGRISPTSGKRLANTISSHGGAAVSEYPFHVAALPPYFPARNRIIAALSDAVVVVESKDTGGALITASFAERQGIPVWAVPGPITSSRSVGTNALIASGNARILTSAQSLLDSLTPQIHPSPLPKSLREPHIHVSEWGADAVTVDEAAMLWKCSIAEAMVRLFDLELDGQVRQLPGGRYQV